MKIVGWFSCGNNSAVMSKMLVDAYPGDDLRLIRCVVPDEHEDNDRFHADVEQWIGRPIERMASEKYANCNEVWEHRQYMSGIKGAPCTQEMKKAVRWRVEKEWGPERQVFGFSSDERHRISDFEARNPEIRLLNPLADHHVTKPMCARLIEGADIILPVLYRLGFANNNCLCCVKATSTVYWAKMRHHFPAVFAQRAELSRRLGCRLTRLKGVRIFLDEIPADFDWTGKDRSKAVQCGVGCDPPLIQRMNMPIFTRTKAA